MVAAFIERLVSGLHIFAATEMIRVLLTLSILACMPLVLRVTSRQLARRPGAMSERRERQVIWRNALILGAVVAIIAIWGSKIAGFALSLAAVAGAMLIVSKEALLNLIGFVNLTITRPFGFGDYVQIGGTCGRVVDIHAMTTTILETRQGHQVTGATVTVPNSLILTHPVRNYTVTGKYVVNLLTIQLNRTADVLAHEKALLAAADSVCLPWQAEADAHLTLLERQKNVDLPSAESRVILEMSEGRYTDLTLRYSCEPNNRVKVEQEILRHYIELGKALDGGIGERDGG